MHYLICCLLVLCALGMACAQTVEFFGPLPHWVNVKTAYGAKGDGVTDDTAALQRACNEVSEGAHSRFLYFPAGTYRVTQTLRLYTKQNANLFGEDPAITTLKWDGPDGNILLDCNGIYNSRISRLTFDGGNKASEALRIDWDMKRNYYTGNNEYSDLILKDAAEGITAGKSDGACAESIVLRCKFLNCWKKGYGIYNFNALNWWIWYSTFEDCGVGAGNAGGAGMFHVYHCLFRRSKVSDIALFHSGGFGIRDNFSVGSKMFLVAKRNEQWGNKIAMQGNTIIDPIDDTAVHLEYPGTLTMLDNVIRSRPGANGPVVQMGGETDGELVALGNIFTVKNTYLAHGRIFNQDDKVVAPDAISAKEPKLPGVLPKVQRAIFEVLANGDGAAIQRAIDAAIASGKPRPVVHIPSGDFLVSQPITVPAGKDVQIVGDGLNNGTNLRWNGAAGQPIIHLLGPSRAGISDLQLIGMGKARGNCIAIDHADQPGGRVFIQHIVTSKNTNAAVLLDGIDDTVMEMRGQNGGDIEEHVMVIGGAKGQAGVPTTGGARVFGTNSGMFAVKDGGRMLIRDLYCENKPEPCLLLTGRATFTLDCGDYKRTYKPTGPGVEIKDFTGKASFLAVSFIDTPVQVDGGGPQTNVLVAGSGQTTLTKYAGPWLTNNTPTAHALFLNVMGEKSTVLPNEGEITPDFIREMYAQTRTEIPCPWPLIPTPNGATDVRIFRITAYDGINGVLISGGTATP